MEKDIIKETGRTYNNCDCGDYEEGCLRCHVKSIKQAISKAYKESWFTNGYTGMLEFDSKKFEKLVGINNN